jgi:hypothetical protein
LYKKKIVRKSAVVSSGLLKSSIKLIQNGKLIPEAEAEQPAKNSQSQEGQKGLLPNHVLGFWLAVRKKSLTSSDLVQALSFSFYKTY